MLRLTFQACNSEEDGLFSFDVNSDGSGHRYVLLIFLNDGLFSSFWELCDEGRCLTSCRHLNLTFKENETNNALDSNGSVLEFPPKQSSYSNIQMNGKEVFRFAVRCVPHSIESALEKAGLPASSIDWLLLHQVQEKFLRKKTDRVIWYLMYTYLESMLGV